MSHVIYISDRKLYYGGFFQGWVSDKNLAHKFETNKEALTFYRNHYGLNSNLKIVKVN